MQCGASHREGELLRWWKTVAKEGAVWSSGEKKRSLKDFSIALAAGDPFGRSIGKAPYASKTACVCWRD